MKEKFSKFNCDLDVWKMVKNDVRFYFSEPNNVHPPTAGLWKNLSTHKYEVWSHFKNENNITFQRAGYCDDHKSHFIINEWLQKILKNALRQYNIESISNWLQTGNKLKN